MASPSLDITKDVWELDKTPLRLLVAGLDSGAMAALQLSYSVAVGIATSVVDEFVTTVVIQELLAVEVDVI